MTTKYMNQENGKIAYDDAGQGLLVVCPIPGRCTRGVSLPDPTARVGWVSSCQSGCARDG
jgi:hypothetical protein